MGAARTARRRLPLYLRLGPNRPHVHVADACSSLMRATAGDGDLVLTVLARAFGLSPSTHPVPAPSAGQDDHTGGTR